MTQTRKGGNSRKIMKTTGKTRRHVPWAGWAQEAPFGAARTRMYDKCGKRKYTSGCFIIC